MLGAFCIYTGLLIWNFGHVWWKHSPLLIYIWTVVNPFAKYMTKTKEKHCRPTWIFTKTQECVCRAFYLFIKQTFQSNEQRLGTENDYTPNHTQPPTYTGISLTHTHTPVLQVWHGEVSADEAHLQTDDLSVFGWGGAAAVFGRPWVIAAAVAGWLWADAVPRQVSHQGWLLEQWRNLTDVLHCGVTIEEAHQPMRLFLFCVVVIFFFLPFYYIISAYLYFYVI